MSTSTVQTRPLEVEQVPIEELHPDPANPRRISDEELEALTRSMRQWGVVQPVLARRHDKIVIGGHQRLVAARRLGLKTVPVVWLDVSVEQARLLNLALNRISGSWDEQLLARLLADLQADTDLDLTLTGFGEDELKELLRSLDVHEKADRLEVFDFEAALEEATRAPRCVAGDLWQLGEHRLLCGDARGPVADVRSPEELLTKMASRGQADAPTLPGHPPVEPQPLLCDRPITPITPLPHPRQAHDQGHRRQNQSAGDDLVRGPTVEGRRRQVRHARQRRGLPAARLLRDR
jgi:ParB-like chromosome segregation protein Spo0J